MIGKGGGGVLQRICRVERVEADWVRLCKCSAPMWRLFGDTCNQTLRL